jgi:hypothetical protein
MGHESILTAPKNLVKKGPAGLGGTFKKGKKSYKKTKKT